MRQLRPWGELLRLSLLPTALADVAVGIVVAHRGRWPDEPRALLLLLASPLVYHGALAVNDWADREHDARTRPDRPIPRGAIAGDSALAAGVAMLFCGVALALFVGIDAGLCLGIVALLAWTYDVRGRGPWRGPLLLAACRAGNIGLGLALIESGPFAGGLDERFLLPVAYGAYVFGVTRLSRFEDAERVLGGTPRRDALIAAALLVGAAFLPLAAEGEAYAFTRWLGRALAIALVLARAVPLARSALAPPAAWTSERVVGQMGRSLRALLAFSAAAACSVGTPTAIAVGLLAFGVGTPLAYSLRRAFPPS